MKIRYLNGDRLYYAFLAGGNAVIQDQNYLNRINVFPVPDADTGTNLASTMRSISEGISAHRSFRDTLHTIADTALSCARGNSGIIFAQFLQGVSQSVRNEVNISTRAFGEAVKSAIPFAYKSMSNPVEGTMLTVMKDWADAVYQHRNRFSDFAELFSISLQAARDSLRETPMKLKVLAKAGVVDAGALGFVDFLEGISHFITKGKLVKLKPDGFNIQDDVHVFPSRDFISQRYCAEALLTGQEMNLDKMKDEIQTFGSSAIVAGASHKARIHLHTDSPADLFYRMKDYGTITQIKVDDMIKQYEAGHERKAEIALVTDSACDLPQEILDDYQIHVLPFHLSFGDNLFLDKVTMTSDMFYTMLATENDHPKTSQPSVQTVQRLFSFLSSHYPAIVAVHISDKLTGMYQSSVNAAENIEGKKIEVINSRHISASQGLILLRVAEAVRAGDSFAAIQDSKEEWIDNTSLFVDVATMKYFVRSGRVSPLKGMVAKMLHLTPIISVDEEGKSVSRGKSFTRKGNMQKILGMVKELTEQGEVWNYAIVHAQNPARAELYAEQIYAFTQMQPAFIMEVAPVIGVHSGIGTLGIAVMIK